MAKVLLATVGSYGDVTPLVGLGRALRLRGHEATLLTNDQFEPLAQEAQLGFRSLGTVAEYDSVLDDRDLWVPHRCFDVLARRIALPALSSSYRHIAELYAPGETLVVATGLLFGARVAHERLGVPLVTLVPQPIWLRSRHHMARGPLAPPPWIGAWGRRALYRLIDHAVDRRLAPSINAFRESLGLHSVRRLLNEWWLSPQCALGLWPAWFAGMQPDWPSQLELTGFLPYNEAPAPSAGSVLFNAAERPIVFSPGSAMKYAHDFFAVAVDVCRQLQRPGLFITRYVEQLPSELPGFIQHHAYLPLDPLLPKCAAIVHHGGMQTTAQAMAAGIPQVVRPTSYDQFDNASRLEVLGVSRTLSKRQFRVANVVSALKFLLESPAVTARCGELAARFRGLDPLNETCSHIESWIGKDSRVDTP